MNTDRPLPRTPRISSTQLGAIGEAIVATRLVLASNGRLAPFTPFADDDGIDLLLYDKVTRRSLPIQVKSRSKIDDPRAGTVQFDVRAATFASDGNSHLIALLLDDSDIQCAWLVPMVALPKLARQARNNFIMVASPKQTSRDKYTPYRHHDVEGLARSLISVCEADSRAI